MALTKQDVIALLESKKIKYEIVEHNAVFTVGEMMDCDLPHPEAVAKNLFIRDDKKQHYYLITCLEDKRVDLKKFRSDHETRALSFASPEDLLAKMGLTPGSVCPFGILNNEEKDIIVYFDKDYENKLMGIHPCDNTATVFVSTRDVVKLLKTHGNEVHFTKI